jgi:hypothetical protein
MATQCCLQQHSLYALPVPQTLVGLGTFYIPVWIYSTGTVVAEHDTQRLKSPV